jgi:hypothetical protein
VRNKTMGPPPAAILREKTSTTDFKEETAQAWQKVCNLQRSDEVIRFIRAPDDRILTIRA